MSGTELARLRRKSGCTQATFVQAFADEAARLGVNAAVSVRQLSRWEKPDPPLPHPGQQAVLEALLGVPLDELGFAVPEHRRSVAAPCGDNERVHRRRFVAAATVATTAAAVARSSTNSRVGASEVAALRDDLLGLYRVDHTSGGDPARRRALVLRRRITERLDAGRCTVRVAHELQSMLGEVQSHIAWFGRDTGRLGEARTACLDGLAAGRLMNEPLLEIRSLASLALLAVDRGNAWEAGSAVQAAQTIARGVAGSTVLLVLSLREASAAEAAADLTAARRALSRALTFHGRADADRDVPPWARYAGAVEVDYAQGSYYLAAAKPRAAVPFLRSAADGLTRSYARNAAVYRARLGLALLAAGDAEEACGQIGSVLDRAHGITSQVMAKRLGEFRHAASRVDTATTRSIVERLDDPAVGTI